MVQTWRNSVVCIVMVFIGISGGCWSAYHKPDVDMKDLSFYQGPSETTAYPGTNSRAVCNVIVMIGDGMGLNQVMLARIEAVAPAGKLHLERMPVIGLVRTHSADDLVTDSAASGTALACGVKTDNGVIGMTPDYTPYRTILEAAKARGMDTGLVVTSAITHATPASYGAHVRDRDDEVDIAPQLIGGQVDLLIGGGRHFFLPRSEGGRRRDRRNLLTEATEAGFTVIETGEQLDATDTLPLLALLQMDCLTTAPPEPSLGALTSKALDLLADHAEGGFFLMVEGSQIDWACHDNDAADCIRQTLLFDLAVKAAVDFAQRDGQTLVLVTSDHETGGLTIPGGNADGQKVKVEWSTSKHTGSPVPIYAFGPGAEDFGGIYDNTEVPRKIAALLKITPWPQPSESGIRVYSVPVTVSSMP